MSVDLQGAAFAYGWARNDDLAKAWIAGFKARDEIEAEALQCWAFKTGLIIERAVIQFRRDRAQGCIKSGQIRDPAHRLLRAAPHGGFDLEGVAVHAAIEAVFWTGR